MDNPRSQPPSAPPILSARDDSAAQPNEALKYLHLLWRRVWLILFFVLVFGAYGVYQVNRAVPVYSTRSVIKYEPAGANIVEFGERSRAIYRHEDINTAVMLIRSPSVAERVLAEMRATRRAAEEDAAPQPIEVTDPSAFAQIRHFAGRVQRGIRNRIVTFPQPDVDAQVLAEQGAVRGLLGQITVSREPQTKIITIAARDRDPARAARVANEFARQFMISVHEEQRQRMEFVRAFVNQQLEETKLTLEEAERNLYLESQQADITVLQENRNIAIATLTSLIADIESRRTDVVTLEARVRALQNLPHDAAPTEIDDFRSTLLARRAELSLQRAQLIAENNEDFPPIRALDLQMAEIDKQIAEAIAVFRQQRARELDLARLTLTALEERLREHEAIVANLEQKMIRFRVLQREVDATRQIFESLLDQFKRMEVTGEAAPSLVSIVEEAAIPRFPSSPNVNRTIMTFLVMGLMAGSGFALLLHWMDRSVRDPRLVEEALGLPNLGFVPFLKEARRGGLLSAKAKKAALLDPSSKSSEAEAIRYLRTSLQYSRAGHAPQVIHVTSCFPQEGKSTISANLAGFFAERGQRVLLIDGDLKRPTVHRTFSVAKAPGLSDVLTGQKTIDQVVVRSESTGVDIMPAGAATPSPVTLLDSSAMTRLIESLRPRYDLVLLDSAPAHGMADALVLATRADGVILVVKHGKTLMEVLSRTAEKLQSIDARILGVVYNSTRARRKDGYYGYGYGYGYGGSYGYKYKESNTDDEEPAESPRDPAKAGR